ncbi:MAG TPA: M23 family metallopeptidase [Euzebyales bacterium]|nr:M23 family metallopeptidase [Euzebyales bacterium]
MTSRTRGLRRHTSLVVTAPVALLVAALVTATTTDQQVAAVTPARRPLAMPRLAPSDGDGVMVMERTGPAPVYEADGQPAWSTNADPALAWPAKGEKTSEFGPRWGRMHKGIDIAADTGTPIVAASDGRVTFSGWKGGYGKTIEIDHGDGVVTRYAHQSETVATDGAEVDRGQVIGRVGMTGSATGPHLHFEVRIDDEARDPRTALPAVG